MEYPGSPDTVRFTVEPCEEEASDEESEQCEIEDEAREPLSEYRDMVEGKQYGARDVGQ